jgi:hypothetical protein
MLQVGATGKEEEEEEESFKQFVGLGRVMSPVARPRYLRRTTQTEETRIDIHASNGFRTQLLSVPSYSTR